MGCVSISVGTCFHIPSVQSLGDSGQENGNALRKVKYFIYSFGFLRHCKTSYERLLKCCWVVNLLLC